MRELLRLEVLDTIADIILKKIRPYNADYDNKPIVPDLRNNTVIAIFAEPSTRTDRRTILLRLNVGG